MTAGERGGDGLDQAGVLGHAHPDRGEVVLRGDLDRGFCVAAKSRIGESASTASSRPLVSAEIACRVSWNSLLWIAVVAGRGAVFVVWRGR